MARLRGSCDQPPAPARLSNMAHSAFRSALPEHLAVSLHSDSDPCHRQDSSQAAMASAAVLHHHVPLALQTTVCYDGILSPQHIAHALALRGPSLAPVLPHHPHAAAAGSNGAVATAHLPHTGTASPFCSVTSEVVRAFVGAHPSSVASHPTIAFHRSSVSDPLCAPDAKGLHSHAHGAGAAGSFASLASGFLNSSAGGSFALAPHALYPSQSCPAHGIKAVCGKRSKMEDMFQVQANFFDLPVSPGCPSDDPHNKLPARLNPHHHLHLHDPMSVSGPGAALLGGGGPSADFMASSSPGTAPGSMPMSPGVGLGPLSELDGMAGSGGSEASSIGDTLHFFGVYDGHGGVQASEHCAKRLHFHLGQALKATCGALAADVPLCCDPPLSAADVGGACDDAAAAPAAALGGAASSGRTCEAEWSLAPTRKKSREIDMPLPSALLPTLAGGPSSCPAVAGGLGGGEAVAAAARHVLAVDCPTSRRRGASVPTAMPLAGGEGADSDGEGGSTCMMLERECSDGGGSTTSSLGSGGSSSPTSVSALLEEALLDAFARTDAEFAAEASASMVGSTAVVALIGTKKLWVANCGDSRAVLCRATKAIQLTDDHKPEREDEAERVERAGGQVLYWNGHRVMGVLAMSRAIGDHALRPYVICTPEITVMTRTDEDDFLLMASDGLWDVMSNQEATNLALRCLLRAREKGAKKTAAVRIAANVLAKAAMDRGSKDNITVVIVDLSGPSSSLARPAGGGAGGAAAAADCDGDGGADPMVEGESGAPVPAPAPSSTGPLRSPGGLRGGAPSPVGR